MDRGESQQQFMWKIGGRNIIDTGGWKATTLQFFVTGLCILGTGVAVMWTGDKMGWSGLQK